LDELYGLGWQHGDRETELYESLTLEDLRAAAARYLQPERAVVAVIRGH
jgi:predicted Zn-dependent peptidase